MAALRMVFDSEVYEQLVADADALQALRRKAGEQALVLLTVEAQEGELLGYSEAARELAADLAVESTADTPAWDSLLTEHEGHAGQGLETTLNVTQLEHEHGEVDLALAVAADEQADVLVTADPVFANDVKADTVRLEVWAYEDLRRWLLDEAADPSRQTRANLADEEPGGATVGGAPVDQQSLDRPPSGTEQLPADPLAADNVEDPDAPANDEALDGP